MEDNTTENTTPQSSPKGIVRRWIFPGFARRGVRYSFALSLFIFAVYMAGSMPDPGFSDHVLFFLLRMLRYSSLLSCAFSLFAMGFSVRRIVHRPNLRRILGLLLYFTTAIISANLVIFSSLIVAASEGNI